MAYDFYAQDSWKPTRDLTLELGLRYSLWQPWGDENQAMASFQSQFYDPATAPVIDRAGGFVVSGDRFNGIVAAWRQRRVTRRWRSSRNSPICSACITACRTASPKRRRTASSRGSGLAYAINERTTFRAGVGRFLNRVQINTTAAYGFNAPLSEMQTVINGNVDAPGGASTRNFPLVGGDAVARLHQPDVVGVEYHGRSRAAVGDARRALLRRAARRRNLERARNINQLQPGTIQRIPG